MFSQKKWMGLLAGVATTIVVAVGQPATAAVNQTYSFERGLSGWSVGYEGSGTYDMYRTTETSYSGNVSVECELDGALGFGTAWMVRGFAAPMDTLVSLDLTFQLYSDTASALNNFEVLAYIGTTPPSSRADFELIGYTDLVAGWQQYGFERLQLTGQYPAKVYVAFGISSNWEYSRTYYMDHVTVSLTP